MCECYDIKSFDCGRGHRSFCIICKIETTIVIINMTIVKLSNQLYYNFRNVF